MTIRDLIRKTQCDTVMSMISLHYGTEHIRKFEALYNKLKNNVELPCASNMTISVNAYREADSSDDMISAESFDENDNSLIFDVSALADGEDIVYSIAATDKSEFIDYRVSEETIGQFSPEAVLAHCLWEITSYSFE